MRGPRRGSGRRVAAALLMLSLGTAAGCGDAGALDTSLNDQQRAQLAVAWTATLAATDPADLPVADRNARATALFTACAPLDPNSPLLTALKQTCKPTAIAAKLAAVLPERCAKPAAICVRALDRIAATTDQLLATLKAFGQQVRQATMDPACRQALVATDAQLKAYGDLSKAYGILALGVQQSDKDIAGFGQRQIDTARSVIQPTGPAATRLAAMKSSCGLADR